MEPLKLAGPKLKLADAMGVIQMQESSNPERFKDISLAWQHSRMHSRANQIWESPGHIRSMELLFSRHTYNVRKH